MTKSQRKKEIITALLYVFLEKVIFLWKLLRFTVVKSLVTNGSRLIAECVGFTFRLWLC